MLLTLLVAFFINDNVLTNSENCYQSVDDEVELIDVVKTITHK